MFKIPSPRARARSHTHARTECQAREELVNYDLNTLIVFNFLFIYFHCDFMETGKRAHIYYLIVYLFFCCSCKIHSLTYQIPKMGKAQAEDTR